MHFMKEKFPRIFFLKSVSIVPDDNLARTEGKQLFETNMAITADLYMQVLNWIILPDRRAWDSRVLLSKIMK